MGGGQAGDELGRDERDVAGEHDHVAVAVDLTRGSANRVARAAGLRLDGECHVGREVAGELASGAADDDDPADAGLERRGDRPGDHRPAAEVVEHLRTTRAHPRADAGGEDDDCWGRHALSVRQGA